MLLMYIFNIFFLYFSFPCKFLDPEVISKKPVIFEEALEIVGDGVYSMYLTFVCGLATLGAIASQQAMFYILPTVSCEMELSSVQAAFLGSAPFIGSMTSSNLFGFLVDQYGRRRIMLITTFGGSLATLIESLSPTPITLMIVTLCTGFMLGGVFGLPYVYLSEFCSKKIQAKYITLAALLAVLSNTYSPSVAWLVMWCEIEIPVYGNFAFTSWRLYLILNILPMFIAAIMLLYLPESPKFLLYMDKHSEARLVLASVYATNNNSTIQEFQVDALRLDAEDEAQKMNKQKQNGLVDFLIAIFRQIKELFSLGLIKYTFMCILLIFATLGLYGVILLWLPHETMNILDHIDSSSASNASLCDIMSKVNTAENKGTCVVSNELFLINMTTGVLFFILNVIVVFLVIKFQVKYILGANILISSAILFLIAFSKTPIIALVALGVSVAVLGASQSLVYNIVVESFPTSLRATASSVFMFFGRLTVPIGGPLVGAAFDNYCSHAYIVIACIFAVIGVICLIVPLEKKKFVTKL